MRSMMTGQFARGRRTGAAFARAPWARLAIGLAVVLVSASSPVRAQPGPVTADSPNAMDGYRDALRILDGLDPEGQAALAAVRTGRATLAERRRVMAALAPIATILSDQADVALFDSGVDVTRGYLAPLDHLDPLGRLADLIALDARLHLDAGRSSDAADRVAALFRLSEHLTRDSLLASSGAAGVIFARADGLTRTAIDRGMLASDEAVRLAEAAAPFDPDDPFGRVEALRTERDFMTDALLARFGEHRTAAAAIAESLGARIPDQIARAELAVQTRDELTSDVEAASAVFDAALAAFAITDPVRRREELTRLDQEIRDGDHGVVVRCFAPSFEAVDADMETARRQLVQCRAWLTAVSADRVDPAALANAAEPLLAAAALAVALPESNRRDYRLIASTPDQAPGEEAAMLWSGAAPIVAQVVAAAPMMRCDFAAADPQRPSACPPFMPALRVSAWATLADAVRAAHAGDSDAASTRLNACFALARSLGADPTLSGSLVGHQVFLDTGAVVARLLDEGLLGPDACRRLAETLELLADARDPFGFQRAARFDRDALTSRLLADAAATGFAPDDPERRVDAVRSILAGASSDQLFALIAMTDVAPEPGVADAFAAVDARDWLGDVVDMSRVADLAAVRRELLDAALEIRAVAVPEQTAGEVGKIAKRQRSAYRDLQRMVQVVETAVDAHRMVNGEAIPADAGQEAP